MAVGVFFMAYPKFISRFEANDFFSLFFFFYILACDLKRVYCFNVDAKRRNVNDLFVCINVYKR